ncbi:MAG: OsmC family protein [Myxococcaceae bacterium]|nr:OsmC family protein [Myxococcaceae bacterium]
MSVEMHAQQSGLTTQLSHGPSGTAIHTVPPRDNGGDASSFSPTDLVGAALASCAITTMVLNARRENLLPLGDPKARVVKVMTATLPRRIAELTLQIDMPAGTKPEHRARLEEIARGCPVARSLHPDVKVPMTFVYPDP